MLFFQQSFFFTFALYNLSCWLVARGYQPRVFFFHTVFPPVPNVVSSSRKKRDRMNLLVGEERERSLLCSITPMPPKKKATVAPDALLASPAPCNRPATPNDFQIVATVRALQTLVNTEAKWSYRLHSAQHAEAVVTQKLKRLEHLKEQCRKCISQLDGDAETVVDEFCSLISPDPAQMQAWFPSGSTGALGPASATASSSAKAVSPAAAATAAAAPTAAKTAAAAAGKPVFVGASEPVDSGSAGSIAFPTTTAAASVFAHLPATVQARRAAQKAALSAMVQAYYRLPRLSREEKKVTRPTSPVDMQRELEEAMRLSTPIPTDSPSFGRSTLSRRGPGESGNGGFGAGGAASLSALSKSQSMVASKALGPAGGTGKAAGRGGSSRKGGGDEASPISATDLLLAQLHEELGNDVHPCDILTLPVPRALDVRLMQRVLVLRSKRLKLESLVALFEKEASPLHDRLRCVADMSQVGQYSLLAVQPRISAVVDQEAAFQRVRASEDEMFRRTAQTPPPTASKGLSKGGGAPAAAAAA
mgnify:CR=1 FL=1